MLLFFSYFSTRDRLAVRKSRQFGYALNLSVNCDKSCCSCYPLFYHNYRPVPEIRSCGIEFLSISYIASKFEDTEYRKICPPDLFRQSKRWTLNICHVTAGHSFTYLQLPFHPPWKDSLVLLMTHLLLLFLQGWHRLSTSCDLTVIALLKIP